MKKSVHGGIDYNKLKDQGISPEEIIDFSVSIFPFEIPDSVKAAAAGAVIDRYPDTKAGALRRAISGITGCGEDEILPVNGTSQAMLLISWTLLSPGDKVIIIGPTYSSYRRYSTFSGAEITEIVSTEKNDFYPNIDNIIEEIRKKLPRIVWLCSPNNPTGIIISKEDISRIQAACIDHGAILVVDQAYLNFSAPEYRFTPNLEDTIILRSMTKDYALAGLRLGYLLGDKKIVQRFEERQPEWSINAPAQEAGAACIAAQDLFEKMWLDFHKIIDQMAEGFKNLGLKVVSSRSNFMLVKVGDVEGLQHHLWKEKILVRNCASFGLPEYIRVGVNTREHNEKLLGLVKEFLEINRIS